MERVDFAIITVIPPEFEAVTRALNLRSLPIDPTDGRLYRYGEVQSSQIGREYSCVAAQCLEKGNIPAAQLTSDIIARWKPSCLLVVGIAGGVKGKESIALGDVVVHDDLEYYSSKKQSGGMVLQRKIQLWPPSPALLNVCQGLREKGWYEKITTPRPDGQSKSVTKLVRGQILSGEILLGDPSSQELSQLLRDFDKGIAVEMESAGVAHALWEKSSFHTVKFIVIRGISDYCNEDRNQETRNAWTPYASDAAACAALSLIQNTSDLPLLPIPASTLPIRRPQLRSPTNPAPPTPIMGREKELTNVVGVTDNVKPGELSSGEETILKKWKATKGRE